MSLLFWRKKKTPSGTVDLIMRTEVSLMKRITIPEDVWLRREAAMTRPAEETQDLEALDTFSEAVTKALEEKGCSLDNWDDIHIKFEHHELVEEEPFLDPEPEGEDSGNVPPQGESNDEGKNQP